MVETTGVEPVVPFGRRIYSPLGLPIFLHLHLLYVLVMDSNRPAVVCQLIISYYLNNISGVLIMSGRLLLRPLSL